MASPPHIVLDSSQTGAARESELVAPLVLWIERHFPAIVLVLGLAFSGNHFFNPHYLPFEDPPIRSDGRGYWAYLPAAVIERDLTLNWMWPGDEPFRVNQGARYPLEISTEGARFIGFNYQPEQDAFANRYPMGVALFNLPLFLVAHVLTLATGGDANGWSFLYQLGAALTSILVLVAGVHLLRALLRRHFTPGVRVLTLASIVFGTNLFVYGTVEGIFSHVYSFLVFAAVLWLVPLWYEDPSLRRSVGLGVLCGLIALLRVPNALWGVVIALYGVDSLTALKERLLFFVRRPLPFAVVALTAIVTFLPQLLYYRFTAGVFFYDSYPDQRFNFLQPEVMNVLFSVRKGLFFWAPLLLPGLVGWFLLKGEARRYLLAACIYFVLQLYLVSSWWHWPYGWSFGHRAFVECLGLFALGLGAFFTAARSSRVLMRATVAFTVVLVFLSAFQSAQYSKGIVLPEKTTWAQYRELFLSFSPQLQHRWRH